MIGDNYVNVDTIAEVQHHKDGSKIIYKDGRCELSPFKCEFEKNSWQGFYRASYSC